MSGEIHMHEDVLVVAERGALGMPEVTINATFAEVFGIVSKMVDALSEQSGIPYNDILDDLKEVTVDLVNANEGA